MYKYVNNLQAADLGVFLMFSMTGYGKGEIEEDNLKIVLEVKSVNHRFLDLGIKLPRLLISFEDVIRNHIKSRISRGHLDVFLSYKFLDGGNEKVTYNESLVAKYLDIANNISDKFRIANNLSVSNLFELKDVIEEDEAEFDSELMQKLIISALNKALDNLIIMRANEGAKIEANLLEKLDILQDVVSKIQKYAPVQVENYREKLRSRVQEALGDIQIDENKLMNEIVFYADKVATDEEFIRLNAHISHFREITKSDEAIGRSLDFILQEMNRESNTIGSKCSDLSVSNYVLTLKTEIEKIREQIQNIE